VNLRSPGRSERRLAARLARGDESSLREIEGEYRGMLRGYLRQALRDSSAAEDVAQQVMIEVWQRRTSFDPARAPMSSWVMMIARSRAIDHMRRQIPEPQDPAVAASLLDRSGAEDDPTEKLAEQWRLAHLLSLLAREEAAVLRMRFHREMSQSEIAASTGIPLGTVKMRMVSALARMRAMIEDEA
jgi:RNA polymerase sigma-70 factor (ECF subfamily)